MSDDLVSLIRTRLLGIAPDEQDLVLEDADWIVIIDALSQPSPDDEAANKAGGLWYRRWVKAMKRIKELEQAGET